MTGGIKMKDKYVETIEAGAGSYPEPPETKEKCYQFDFDASIKGYGIVYAKDEREAKEFAESGNYDDIIDTWDMHIEEITSVRED